MSGFNAYQIVYRFIADEHTKRKWRAEQELWPDQSPITEAEEALTALEWLRQAASVTKPSPPTHKQESLI